MDSKQIAQVILREMLDKGVTPNGNLQQAGNYIPLLQKVVDEAKSAAREAARKQFTTLNDTQLIELVSSELASSNEVGTLLSDVVATSVQWLWKYRIALGKIAIVDGDPGLGKSLIMLDLAARVSMAREMPDGDPGIPGGGGVVLITPEDALDDTIQPRLARAGANLRRIISIGTIETTDEETGYTYKRPFSLPEDLSKLEAAIKRVKAKLIIIDPVMAILGNKDTYKDNEVRVALAPIQMLAEKLGVAVVLLRHLTKNGGDNALYRGGGSMAFIALARTGLLVAKDPMDETRCVLAHIKTNISKYAANLTYRVVSDEEMGDDRPYVKWEGESQHTVTQLITHSADKPGEGRLDILKALTERYPEALSPQDIVEMLPHMNKSNVTVTLKRMVEDGQIEKSARGLYATKHPA